MKSLAEVLLEWTDARVKHDTERLEKEPRRRLRKRKAGMSVMKIRMNDEQGSFGKEAHLSDSFFGFPVFI